MVKFNFKKYLFTLIGVISSTFIFSQYHIKGQVFTENHEVLVSGNILAYNAIDSTFITGGIIAEGIFDLFPINADHVILKVKSIETEDYYQNVSNTDSSFTIDLGELILKNSEYLKTVEVIEYIPLYEVDGTTTKVNVENTLLSESITPLEILKRSPGVRIQDGSVTVIGRGNTLIYVDGQQVTIDQFNLIPVNQIIRIEIIKDPSAKYGSEAGAVINVITKNYYREGFQVNIRQAILAPTFVSSTSIGLNFEEKKWLLQANYSSTLGNSWNTVTRETERSGSYKTELELLEESSIQQHNGSFGVSYKIDSTSTVTLEYKVQHANVGVLITSNNKVYADQYTQYDALNKGAIGFTNQSLIGNYKKKIDSLGSSLFIGAQYTGYRLGLEERISEDILIANNSIENSRRQIVSNNWINLFSGQVDYQKFVSQSFSLSTGMRYSNSINKGDLNMNNQVEEALVLVSNYSSTTEFTEQQFAIYGELNKRLGTFDFRAGLRFERTTAEGITTQENQMSLSRTYNWFIPSILISKKINKRVGLNLSYNIYTGRPSYNELDPKVFYIDSLTSKQGNPLLLPQLDHSVKFAITIGPMQLDATYYRSINAFKNITKEGLGGVNSIVLFRENVNADRFYASATIPLQNKFMSAYFNYSVNWDKVLGEYGDFSSIDLKPYHYLYLYAQIKLKRIVNIELIANYFSGRYDGIYQDLNSYSVSFGLSKSFLKDQLKCSILANDILFTEREAGTYYIGDYSVSYLDKSYTQYIRFSLNYNFGKLKERNYQSIDVGNDEKERLN
ncbi:MAG: hypothetical protein ACI8ZM_001763 [Crocinitomix sp.]|jgi:hypothetical protein